jgi:hypothetical protein
MTSRRLPDRDPDWSDLVPGRAEINATLWERKRTETR